ncbi:MAG: valine--tRNA ligase [Bacteroidales bacterium]|nr:valine--tRNA ligase [Bacteroidales bacterium]
MEVSAKYDPSKTEDKWYSYWMEKGFFHSQPDEREAFTIVIPPPNVTGVLHMGHMLNNTIQDVLVRRARMQGKNACWLPGTDHASIATEARVVAKLQKAGIQKTDLTRNEFLAHAWEWKEEHGGIILEQLKKLGASCDWDRTKFTMDDQMSESVIKVFVDLFRKGYIYRGVRMVNWDPQAKTAVSDEEVNHKEVQSKLYYVRYLIDGTEDEYLTIATTRPETILGDTAVCVNPGDDRFKHLAGKKVVVPMVNRVVPIIQDDYVDIEFGTGALKITPAHDINDYEIGLKHKLEIIDIFNPDGTISDAGALFVGEDRFKARKLAVKELEKLNCLVKVEDYVNKVGYSERTDAVIEPKLSVQWFMSMKELAEPALDAVNSDEIQLHPPKFKNIYRHWMENVRDWCISRQLWWGQRIPAWYLPGGEFVIAENEEEALILAREKTGNPDFSLSDMKQDEDVLDTWFSSWLWPISVFDGIRNPNNKDIQYYYPTNDLVTAPEILFFWVARMIVAGYEYLGKKPFNSVYLTGIVRDSQRRKMSKSLGNSPNPLDLISQYGADGVRVGMLLCSPAGNDLLFEEALIEQGRNFGNKIWNAYRLVAGWEEDDEIKQAETAKLAGKWFDTKLKQAIIDLEDQYSKYRLSSALMICYRLFWDDFSSWYLEIIKPDYGAPIDAQTKQEAFDFMEKLLLVLHPFMPFITEELWQAVRERQDGESIMIASMPTADSYDADLLDRFDRVKELIVFIRSVRAEKNILMRNSLKLQVRPIEGDYAGEFDPVIAKLANLDSIDIISDTPEGAVSQVIKAVEFFVLLEGMIDPAEEKAKIEKELGYAKGFLAGVEKKLSNERFVQGAPAKVVEKEQQKKADAEAKVKALEAQLKDL